MRGTRAKKIRKVAKKLYKRNRKDVNKIYSRRNNSRQRINVFKRFYRDLKKKWTIGEIV